MTHTPLVSVVLPTYNGARYVAESIQSCLDQSYPQWELIVVDDCSTDTTPEILAGVAAQEKRIRIIRHEHNKKLPGALNTGFRATQGHYLTWTSDDNLYRPDALAVLVETLDSHPEVGLVYADFTRIDAQGEVCGFMRVLDPEALVSKSCVGPCFLYRRAVYEAVGDYDEGLFLAEDYDYWLRASAQFRMLPLHRDLYLYREHGGSLTGQFKPQALLAREQMLRRNLPHLTWATARHRAEIYLHLAELARTRGDQGQARRYWWQALREDPLLVLRRGAWNLAKRFGGDDLAQRITRI